ncbi:MAG: hypothetical protein ACREAE_05370 [Nitrosopumilaceae archaeon]
MKFIIITVFVLLFTTTLLDTYAQSSESANITFFIFVQTQVRNSDGQLVAYLEANKIAILQPEKLDKFLDSKPVTSIVTSGGDDFELIQVDVGKQVEESDVISKTVLGTMENDIPVLLAVSDHDGYPIASGDTVTSIWTVIRPAR